MRPIDSAYDRAAATAERTATEIIARLENGELVAYEEIEELDDMSLGIVLQRVAVVEDPGFGYRAA